METSPVPVMISDEASARVASLGMQREMALMIEHVKQTAPRLVRIEVTIWHDGPGSPEDKHVMVRAVQEPPATIYPVEFLEVGWGSWVAKNFSLAVTLRFVMISSFLFYPPKAA